VFRNTNNHMMVVSCAGNQSILPGVTVNLSVAKGKYPKQTNTSNRTWPRTVDFTTQVICNAALLSLPGRWDIIDIH